MRHRAGRHARRPDRGLPAAGARAGADARRAAADRRRGDDHRRRRHHGGRSAERARHRGRSSRAPRRWRASRPTGIDVDAGAASIDLTLAGARYDVMKARARRAHHRAGVRSGRGGGRLVGAVPSRARGQADRRQRRRGEADRGVPGAGSARRAGACCAAAGVPNFRTPEACADAVAAALQRRAPRPIADAHRAARAGAGRMLDELEADALLDRLGIPRAPSVALDAGIDHARRRCRSPIRSRSRRCRPRSRTSPTSAASCSMSRTATRCSRRSGRSAPMSRSADRSVDRVLVQPMIAGLGEVLIGYRVDPDVGPLVMLAAGGILAEIYRDRSLRLAPVDLADAQEMIGEVRGAQGARRLSRQAAGRSRRAGAGAGGAVAACGPTDPPSPRPRSIR